MKMKHIPNILSVSRMPLALSLLFLTQRPYLFVSVYCVTGMTDVLDGFLARRYKWTSELGAKIDGFADILFMLSILAIAFFVIKMQIKMYVYIGIAAVAAIKLVNLGITKAKFKNWNTMHTWANKISGLPFFIVVPACIVLNTVPNAMIFIFLCFSAVAALEETVILLSSDEHHTDVKTIFHLNKAS